MGCDDYPLTIANKTQLNGASPITELAVARACLAEADSLPAVTRLIEGAEAI